MRKATNGQIEQRVQIVQRMIVQGDSTAKILQYCSECWAISTRQGETYIQRASERIRAAGAVEAALELGRAIERLHDLYAAAAAGGQLRTCLAVAQELHKLLGLYPPHRAEIGGLGGGPLQIERRILPPLPADVLDDILQDG